MLGSLLYFIQARKYSLSLSKKKKKKKERKKKHAKTMKTGGESDGLLSIIFPNTVKLTQSNKYSYLSLMGGGLTLNRKVGGRGRGNLHDSYARVRIQDFWYLYNDILSLQYIFSFFSPVHVSTFLSWQLSN